MNKKVLILLSLTVLMTTGCKSVPKSRERITLNGMVYDTQNRPVANYRILIDGNGKCTSDIGGRFVINGIRKGEHVFSGWGEGYLKVEEKIVVRDKSQILYIRVPTVESRFKEAFEFIKRGELERAEKNVREVLDSDAKNEDALYFIEVIERLRGMNEKKDD